MKKLVAFFSATNITKKISQELAIIIGADLYEIKPIIKYKKEDLDWTDNNSRSTIEMKNLSMRPGIIKGDIDIEKYDTIYLGFPIWWYIAPTIINTFLESYNFNNKKIILFASSGISDFGKTLECLKPSAPDSTFIIGQVYHDFPSKKTLEELGKL